MRSEYLAITVPVDDACRSVYASRLAMLECAFGLLPCLRDKAAGGKLPVEAQSLRNIGSQPNKHFLALVEHPEQRHPTAATVHPGVADSATKLALQTSIALLAWTYWESGTVFYLLSAGVSFTSMLAECLIPTPNWTHVPPLDDHGAASVHASRPSPHEAVRSGLPPDDEPHRSW